ncbi:MAG: folate-binding protein, partial [Nocardioidaceae bacterium]
MTEVDEATWSSPLLGLPGAVAADGVDAGVAAHYGDPFREQKTLLAGDGFADLSHRGVITVKGPDRLTWLHSLTTQFIEGLAPHTWVTTLILSPQGHVEHEMTGYDDGETLWAHVEPGRASSLVAWLDSMRFMMRVEVA